MSTRCGIVPLTLLTLLAAPLATQREVGFLPERALRWGEAGPTGGARARAAVIVTADRYGNAAFDVPSAKPSGEALRQALVQHAGFSRASIVELSRDQVHEAAVQAAIERAASSIGDGKTIQQGTLLVLWVGHGFTQGGEQQLFGHFTQQVANGFAPVVTQRQLVAWLDAAYAAARTRGVELATALVVDACRPNVAAPPKDAVAVRAKAWQVFSATSGKFALAPSPGAPFVFSQAFAEALDMRAKQSGTADLGDVFRQAKELTERRTAGSQVPELVPPSDSVLAKTSPAVVVPRRIAFRVRLVDALTGGRVERAAVRLDDTKHETSEGGLALAAAPGNHQLEVHAEGYLTRSESLPLGDERADGEVTVPLLPHVTVLRVRVTPPRVVEVRAQVAGARDRYHVLSGVTDGKGEVELRVPATGARIDLQLMRGSRRLEVASIDAQPSAWLRDRSGQHAGIPLVEAPVALSKAALDQLGDDLGLGVSDSAAPDEQPDVRGFDASEWQAARQNIAYERWDLARTNLQNIEAGGSAMTAWRRYVDARWARARLERALATGRRNGDFDAADEVVAWWKAAQGNPQVANQEELSRLMTELERERVPLAVRQGFEAGNRAYAAGDLEQALDSYLAVRSQANADYGQRFDEQIEDIRTRLYSRHLMAGNQHEADGDLDKARASYKEALKYNERARRYLARLDGTAVSELRVPGVVEPRKPDSARTAHDVLASRWGLAMQYVPDEYELLAEVDFELARRLGLDRIPATDDLAKAMNSAMPDCDRALMVLIELDNGHARGMLAIDTKNPQRVRDLVFNKESVPVIQAKDHLLVIADTDVRDTDRAAKPAPGVAPVAEAAESEQRLFFYSMALSKLSQGHAKGVTVTARLASSSPDRLAVRGTFTLLKKDAEDAEALTRIERDPRQLMDLLRDRSPALVVPLLEQTIDTLRVRVEGHDVHFEFTSPPVKDLMTLIK
ncbi:MAG: tetratricopeptide repeat protein [Planctomycetota bacterium]